MVTKWMGIVYMDSVCQLCLLREDNFEDLRCYIIVIYVSSNHSGDKDPTAACRKATT